MRHRRRRGALSATGGTAVTCDHARGTAGGPVADLTAIRHSGALLDLLARRELSQSLIRRDPALAVLSVLAADVDGPAAVTGAARRAAARRLAAWRAQQLAGQQAGRIAARHAELAARARATRAAQTQRDRGFPAGVRRPAARPAARARSLTMAAIAGSALAAFVLAVVAAGSTGIVAAGLLARLARLGPGTGGRPGRLRHRRPPRAWLAARLPPRPLDR